MGPGLFLPRNSSLVWVPAATKVALKLNQVFDGLLSVLPNWPVVNRNVSLMKTSIRLKLFPPPGRCRPKKDRS